MVYLIWSLRYGKPATPDPWSANGLEWTVASPPQSDNFAETPLVTWDAYNYDEINEARKLQQEVDSCGAQVILGQRQECHW